MPLTVDASSTFHPTCRWIGPTDWRDDARCDHDQPFLFVRQLNVSPHVERITITIAATPRYAMYLNGAMVHEGPARSLPGEVYADTIELPLPAARQELVLAVVILPFTGGTAASVHDRVGLFGQIEVDEAGKRTCIAVTDDSWRCRAFHEVSFHGRLLSLATSQQEHWTAGLARLAGIEDSATPARVLGGIGTPPWRATLKRDCEHLRRELITTTTVYHGLDNGECLPAAADLARSFNDRAVSSVKVEDDDNDVLLLDRARNIVTFDAGRTRLVRPVINVTDSAAGDRLEIFYDIGLVDRPRASLGFDSVREGFVDTVTCTGFPFTWQPIAPRGARYITFRYAGAGRAHVRISLEGVEYPQTAVRGLHDNHPVLQQIWDRSVATLRSATVDVIVDTCWRENVLWTFDAAVTGKAHFIAFGDPTMWRRCLGLIARWAKHSGDWPSSIVPAGTSAVILPDQTLRAIIALGDYARLTGDFDFARDAMAQFEQFLTACTRCVTADGLFVPPDWCWHWIDWAPIDRRSYSLPINLLLMMACETYAEYAAPNASAIASNYAAVLRRAAMAFWDDVTGCYRDRVVPAIPTLQPNQVIPMPSAEVSAHANAMALEARLGSEQQQSRVANYLASRLTDLPFGPGWTDLVLGPLVDRGHGKAALDHLARLYGPWIESGQPTWSEAFSQLNYVTAHGWGATAISVLARANLLKSAVEDTERRNFDAAVSMRL